MATQDETEKRQLSFSKFVDLLEKNSYSLISTYCTGDDVKFAEIRTPRVQKTFIVYIPDRYSMNVDDRHRRLQLSSKQEPTGEQSTYMMNVKGPLLDCDLIAVSSWGVCMYRNNGVLEYYSIRDGSRPDSSDSAEPPEDDEEEENYVDTIIKSTSEVIKKIDPTDTLHLPSQQDIEDYTKSTKTDDVNTEDAQTDATTEVETAEGENAEPEEEETVLEFQDEEGNVIEDAETSGEPEGAEKTDDAEDVNPETEVKIKPKAKPLTLAHPVDNSLPTTLEDGDVAVGIIYYLIEINQFFKKLKAEGTTPEQFENDLLAVYDALDDNETEYRNDAIDKIAEICTKVHQNAKIKMDFIRSEEVKLRGELVKLSSVLSTAEQLKTKTKDAKKFGELRSEVDRIHHQTRTTIHELNVELLRLRDEAQNFLNNCQSTLEELLEL